MNKIIVLVISWLLEGIFKKMSVQNDAILQNAG